MAGTNGFVQLRRGIYSHLQDMTDLEFKVYGAVLILADHKSGQCRISVRDLAADLGKSATRVSAALRTLAEPHGPSKVRYLDYTPAANQHSLTTITVVKYKASAVSDSDTAPDTATAQQATQQPHSNRTATAQHGTSEQGKPAPNNQKNQKNQDNQKKSTKPNGADATDLAERFVADVRRVNSKARIQVMGTDRVMLELLATYTKQDVESVLSFLAESDFWRSRIVTPNKLLEHFDALFAQANDDRRWQTPDGIDIRSLAAYDNA